MNGAALGAVPGLVIVVLVAAFYVGLLVTAYAVTDDDGELSYGDVHV